MARVNLKALTPVDDHENISPDAIVWGAQSVSSLQPATFTIQAVWQGARALIFGTAGTEGRASRWGADGKLEDTLVEIGDDGEITAPGGVDAPVAPSLPNPAGGFVRLYARAVSGAVRLVMRLSTGVETVFRFIAPPATSTDRAVPSFNGTTGEALRSTGVSIDASDNIQTPGGIIAQGSSSMAVLGSEPSAPSAGKVAIYAGTHGGKETIIAKNSAGETFPISLDGYAAVAAEETARIAADDALDTRVSAIEADNATGTELLAEATTREQADAALNLRLVDIEEALEGGDTVAAEAATRAAADTALSDRLDVLEADPVTATEVASAVSAEAALRAAADSAEATARAAADDTEATTRQLADGALGSRIDDVENDLTAEATARSNADTALQGNIDSEASTRASADTALQANIDSEASTRASADTALSGRLDVLEADPTTATALAAEASARTSADNSLSARLSTLEADPTTQTALDTAINTEASTRAAADTALQGSIDDLDGRLDVLEADPTTATALSNEASTRAAADTALQTNIDSEASTRATADTALSDRLDVLEADPTTATALATETTARTSADTALSGRLDTLEADPTTATAVATAVATEASARTTADDALDARLDVIEADYATSADIASEASTRASADTALDGRLAAVEAWDADDIAYSNATSGLTATTVQDAIDEALGAASGGAADITYDNATSGLTADDVQAAIDELAAGGGGGGGGGAYPLILLKHTEADGVNGGGLASGADRDRKLNTLEINEAPARLVSFNATTGEFTLAGDAGEYIYEMFALIPACRVGRHQSWLQNVTDGAVQIVGSGNVSTAASSAGGQNYSTIRSRFTLTANKTFKFQTRVANTENTVGAGFAGGFGKGGETYLIVAIEVIQ